MKTVHMHTYLKIAISGDFVYAVDAFDPDEGINGQLTFELSGKDAAKFLIDRNGVIVSKAAVNTLDTFSLMATVYDGLGLNASTALGFYVRLAKDFPVFKVHTLFLKFKQLSEKLIFSDMTCGPRNDGLRGIIRPKSKLLSVYFT
jgi:hypothetical protein